MHWRPTRWLNTKPVRLASFETQRLHALADKNYLLLKSNPEHPSLHFKPLGDVWSVRVGAHYRALRTEVEDGIVWFWIGTHDEYDKIVG